MNTMLLLLSLNLCGQTTHPFYLTLGEDKTLRVFQVVDKENVLADLETYGHVGSGSMSMAPLMRGSQAANRAIASSGRMGISKKMLWLICPTADMVDDGWGYYKGRTFAYAGTKTYETHSGSSTVPVYKLLSPEEAAKHVEPAPAVRHRDFKSWTDKKGSAFVGEFVKVERGKAHFILREEKKFSIAISALSKESVKVIHDLRKDKKR